MSVAFSVRAPARVAPPLSRSLRQGGDCRTTGSSFAVATAPTALGMTKEGKSLVVENQTPHPIPAKNAGIRVGQPQTSKRGRPCRELLKVKIPTSGKTGQKWGTRLVVSSSDDASGSGLLLVGRSENFGSEGGVAGWRCVLRTALFERAHGAGVERLCHFEQQVGHLF